MRTPKELIDAAASVAGSYSEVARRLGVSPQQVQHWKGLKPCPLHVQAQLAAMAGLDWKTHVCDVIAAKPGNAIATVAAVAVLAGMVSPADRRPCSITPCCVQPRECLRHGARASCKVYAGGCTPRPSLRSAPGEGSPPPFGRPHQLKSESRLVSAGRRVARPGRQGAPRRPMRAGQGRAARRG